MTFVTDNLEQLEGTPGSPDGSVTDGISEIFNQSGRSASYEEPEKQPEEVKTEEKISADDKPETHEDVEKVPEPEKELSYEEAYSKLKETMTAVEARQADLDKREADLEKQRKGLDNGMREKSEAVKEAMRELGLEDQYNEALKLRRTEKKISGEQRPPVEFQRMDYIPDKVAKELERYVPPLKDARGNVVISSTQQIATMKPLLNTVLNMQRYQMDQSINERIEKVRAEFTPITDQYKLYETRKARMDRLGPEVLKFKEANKLNQDQVTTIINELTQDLELGVFDNAEPEYMQRRIRQALYDPGKRKLDIIPGVPPPDKIKPSVQEKTREKPKDPIAALFRRGTGQA